MANQFSNRSKQRLSTCHPDLQRLMNEVIKEIDITILCGYRSPADQLRAYKKGTSKRKFGNHNYNPSRAVDIQPYGVNLKEMEDHGYQGWREFCEKVMEIAERLGLKDHIRSGGLEWGWDYYHFELKGQPDTK